MSSTLISGEGSAVRTTTASRCRAERLAVHSRPGGPIVDDQIAIAGGAVQPLHRGLRLSDGRTFRRQRRPATRTIHRGTRRRNRLVDHRDLFPGKRRVGTAAARRHDVLGGANLARWRSTRRRFATTSHHGNSPASAPEEPRLLGFWWTTRINPSAFRIRRLVPRPCRASGARANTPGSSIALANICGLLNMKYCLLLPPVMAPAWWSMLATVPGPLDSLSCGDRRGTLERPNTPPRKLPSQSRKGRSARCPRHPS